MFDTLLNLGVSALGKYFSAANDYKALLESKTVALRALYLEIQANIDLLDIIKLDNITKEKVYSKSIKSIISNLEMQMIASVIFSDNAVSKELAKQFAFYKDIEETAENDNKKKKVKKTPLQAMVFILRKTSILQKLASYEDEEDKDIVSTLRLKVRITNIKTHLLFLKDFLKELNKEEKFLFE